MHEFHGWVAIPDVSAAVVEAEVSDVGIDGLVSVAVSDSLNGFLTTLSISGLRNHSAASFSPYSLIITLTPFLTKINISPP